MLSVSVNSSNGNAAESVFRNGFGYTNKTLSDWILRGPTSDATYFADYIAIGCQPQWGVNIHGWVTFPITFVKFRRLVTNHQGNVFMDSKSRESNTLSGFTLDVADNSDQNKDAQWIAIGA